MGAHERSYTIHRGIFPCEENVTGFFRKFANPKHSSSRPIKNAFRAGDTNAVDAVRYMREFVPTDLDYNVNEYFEAMSSWFKVAYNAECSAWSLLWNQPDKESSVQTTTSRLLLVGD